MILLLLCNRQVYLARSFAEKVLDNALSVNLKLKLSSAWLAGCMTHEGQFI